MSHADQNRGYVTQFYITANSTQLTLANSLNIRLRVPTDVSELIKELLQEESHKVSFT